ncbi:DUF488 domain-containing protein [Microbacterium suwonense]|uniref:DUF488 domain-containing protein n=1 Tax=Microbacterium suwonense TaxID=683047 RepID=A0ABM8FT41_9MICO|nr:DUF488 domain-containing protein [Microbacterium suwonense]BDZ38678.1 hypothetical protein GCM10025863_12920 [Microbacterium suwonense]
MTEPAILTIGHSTHPLDGFLALLRGAGVGTIIDVRRLPGSRRCPWFDQDDLSSSLAEAGIRYQHVPELTGRRPAQHDVPDEVNALWRNRSFHNYADYAMGAEFARGLEQLIAQADPRHPPAVMCSEAVWWRCHRRLIADHLIAHGVDVGHLMPDGRVVPAELTPGAVVAAGNVEYPAADATSPAAAPSRPPR